MATFLFSKVLKPALESLHPSLSSSPAARTPSPFSLSLTDTSFALPPSITGRTSCLASDRGEQAVFFSLYFYIETLKRTLSYCGGSSPDSQSPSNSIIPPRKSSVLGRTVQAAQHSLGREANNRGRRQRSRDADEREE